MTALLQEEELYLSFEEYRAFEERSEIKHEYINGYVQAMAGASGEHNVITSNLLIRLGMQLLGKRCFPYGSDKPLLIHRPELILHYYPDVTVDCSGVVTRETTEPTVIFEVTSPGTVRADFGEKLINYLNLPSMRVYALVDQKRPFVTVHRRQGGNSWTTETLRELNAELALPEIECVLPVREIYERIDFSPTVE